MQNGLYKVSFVTPKGQGTGIVVIVDGSIKGGDASMYYIGTYVEKNNQLTGKLHVRKHSEVPGIISVFGLDDVHLKLQGTSTNVSATIEGFAAEAPQIPLQAQLTLLV